MGTIVVTRAMATGPGDTTMARGGLSLRPPLLPRPMLRPMLMPTTEATMAMALVMAMVDTDLAMDMEDMVDMVLDSMERERLSLVIIMDMERGGAMDTDPEDTTMARGRLMPSLVTVTITRDMAMDTGPEDTTTARGRPSLDMVTDTDTRDTGTMAMDTVSTMDKKAES